MTNRPHRFVRGPFARLRIMLALLALALTPVAVDAAQAAGKANAKPSKTVAKAGKTDKAKAAKGGKAKVKGKSTATKASPKLKTTKASKGAKADVGKGKAAKPVKGKAAGVKGKKSLKPAKPGKGKFAAKVPPDLDTPEVLDEPETKAPVKDTPAKDGKEDVKEPVKAAAPVKEPKPAKPAPTIVHDSGSDLDAFEGDEASTGPLFFVFVLAVLCIVAAFAYKRYKQRQPGGGARENLHFDSSPDAAFSSQLSSFKTLPPKSTRDAPSGGSGDDTDPGTDPNGGGKKRSWKDKLFGQLKDKAKAKAADAAKGALGEVAQNVGAGIGDAVGGGVSDAVGGAVGDKLGGDAQGLAGDLAGAAADKAVGKAVDKAAGKAKTAVAARIVGKPEDAGLPAVPAAAAPAPAAAGGEPKLDWAGWDSASPEEFWYRVYDVEDGGMQGDEQLAAKLKKWKLKDKAHFDAVKDAYVARHGSHPEFTQAMMNGRMRQSKEKAPAPANSAPADGADPCTFERWVEIQVAQACWAEQKLDIAANLQSNFGMSLVDWSNVSAYWSQKYLANVALKKDFDRFEKKYKLMYGAAA